jgi:hypothetical protein
MTDAAWLMRIEGGLSASFLTPEGPSRPGVLWKVGLKHGEATYTVHVRALLADDATAATRRDEAYQARTTMEYLDDRLRDGWHPTQDEPEVHHVIHIGNPINGSRRPWWRFW